MEVFINWISDILIFVGSSLDIAPPGTSVDIFSPLYFVVVWSLFLKKVGEISIWATIDLPLTRLLSNVALPVNLFYWLKLKAACFNENINIFKSKAFSFSKRFYSTIYLT